MIRPLQLALTCTSLVGLNACIGLEPTSVTQLEPKGDTFQKALHAEYAELAVKESQLYDFGDATTFAEKAQAAADGQEVQPEMPAIWGIDSFAAGELEAARAQMVTVFETTPARTAAPLQAAAAQAAYDCWLEEQQEGHQLEDITACRQRFEASMAEVQTALQPAVVPAAGRGDVEVVEREYEVFFPINSTRLSSDGESVVYRLADAARELGTTRITVAGHADRSGSRAYNERLSRQRAEAVAQELVRMGLPASMIHTAGFGEDQPAVMTSDGAAHQMNRRVVVRLL